MTQAATAVIVTEPQWRELNPGSFGRSAVPRLVLSSTLSSCALTIVQMEVRGGRPLELLIYQLSWSVIVIANGFSRGLATINRLGWN